MLEAHMAAPVGRKLPGEDMLDGGARLRFGGIALK
jgi:hypothetical protein